MVRLRRMPSSDLAYFTAYERKGTAIEFILDPNRHPHIDFHTDPVAVVGNFNDWGSCSIGPILNWNHEPETISRHSFQNRF